MKKKYIIFFIASMVIFISCKKNETLDSVSSQEQNLMINATKANVKNSYIGECTTNTADSMANWVHTYGAGGEKEDDFQGAWDALGDISSDRYECKSGSKPGQKSYPIFFAPPIYETEGIKSLQELLNSLGIADLCNSLQLANAKLKLAPINVVINRAINGLSGSASYYSLNNNERLYEILTHFHSNESYLLEDNGFTLLYLIMVANRDFAIPENVAVNLFDKSPLYHGPGPVNSQFYDWGGFIIDGYDGNTYCTIAYQLPLPLPPFIYYSVNYPNDASSSINFATSIYNVGGSYVTTNFPEYAYVPDGYYKHPNDANNHNYYHIVNGGVVGIVQAIIDPNAPVLAP